MTLDVACFGLFRFISLCSTQHTLIFSSSWWLAYVKGNQNSICRNSNKTFVLTNCNKNCNKINDLLLLFGRPFEDSNFHARVPRYCFHGFAGILLIWVVLGLFRVVWASFSVFQLFLGVCRCFEVFWHKLLSLGVSRWGLSVVCPIRCVIFCVYAIS